MNIEKTITTVDIAEMMGMRHDRILRKLEGQEVKGKHIKGIIEILTDHNLGVSNFFQESSYIDESGKENKCYNLTRKGCEFLAHKFQGEKGIRFTAEYINRFHTMENAILTASAQQSQQLDRADEFDWKLNDLNKRMRKLENSKLKPKPNKRYDSWYKENSNRIWAIKYALDMEIKAIYSYILKMCSEKYDIGEANRIYTEDVGEVPEHQIDLVSYFTEFEEIANGSLDYLESKM